MAYGHHVSVETSASINERLGSKHLDAVDDQCPESIDPHFFRRQRSLAAQIPGIDDLRVTELPSRYPALFQSEVNTDQGIAQHESARSLRDPREVLVFQPSIQ